MIDPIPVDPAVTSPAVTNPTLTEADAYAYAAFGNVAEVAAEIANGETAELAVIDPADYATTPFDTVLDVLDVVENATQTLLNVATQLDELGLLTDDVFAEFQTALTGLQQIVAAIPEPDELAAEFAETAVEDDVITGEAYVEDSYAEAAYAEEVYAEVEAAEVVEAPEPTEPVAVAAEVVGGALETVAEVVEAPESTEPVAVAAEVVGGALETVAEVVEAPELTDPVAIALADLSTVPLALSDALTDIEALGLGEDPAILEGFATTFDGLGGIIDALPAPG